MNEIDLINYQSLRYKTILEVQGNMNYYYIHCFFLNLTYDLTFFVLVSCIFFLLVLCFLFFYYLVKGDIYE